MLSCLLPQLFHFRESGRREISTFSSGALFVFFVPYTIMACLTYGIAVPSGLFVPSLLSGAAFGEDGEGEKGGRREGSPFVGRACSIYPFNTPIHPSIHQFIFFF